MYELYRVVKTKDEYYASWDQKNASLLTEELREAIYGRYIIKCFVFQRDGFKCQNVGCIHTQSELTMHHIRFQKNNGKDSVKNCVTICKSCHNRFHRGKGDLTFGGMTYRVSKSESVDWKVIRKQNKDLRKNLRAEFASNPIHITAALFEQLMRFLAISFEDMEEVDDD